MTKTSLILLIIGSISLVAFIALVRKFGDFTPTKEPALKQIRDQLSIRNLATQFFGFFAFLFFMGEFMSLMRIGDSKHVDRRTAIVMIVIGLVIVVCLPKKPRGNT